MNDKKIERYERKFIIDENQELNIMKKIRNLMMLDPYAGIGGSYYVRSLYFDTINNYDYYSKEAGIENRQKIRIRIYNEDSKIAKLESKRKNLDLQEKVSMYIEEGHAKEIINGNIDITSATKLQHGHALM